jgi:hypothetical protein
MLGRGWQAKHHPAPSDVWGKAKMYQIFIPKITIIFKCGTVVFEYREPVL